ncbi:hypothetical protein STAQ_16150 [Allostella sp. ATCC 35155]|nr:hypothetical protein STAQ_16150 [Stella sp. ATCC 35155]
MGPTEPLMNHPDSRSGTLAICTIARDEARYVLEWVAFHLLAGVEHFCIYDNESVDGTGQILSALGRYYPVEVTYWPSIEGRSPHYSALEDGYAKLRGRFSFVATMDLDEFLFSAGNRPLAQWLRGLDPDVSAVGINQLVFGSSGERRYRPDLVVSRFTHRKPLDSQEHHFVKSIVRPERIVRVHAHIPGVEGGRYVHADLSDLVEMEAPHGRASQIVASDIRLHHYMLKSAEEFDAKRQRGGGTSPFQEQRSRRYGADFFSVRDGAASTCMDDTLAARSAPVRELMAEMAGRIAEHVGRERLESYYSFLSAKPRPRSAATREGHSAGRTPARPRLFMHIGLHKTGTTSLQSYFARNRDTLAASGLTVPRAGVPRQFDGHHLLPWTLNSKYPERLSGIDPDTLWNGLRSELESAGTANAILSSEDFSLLDDRQVERLGALLDGFDIVPIIILRRPGDVLEGGYRTHVVSGGDLPLRQFMNHGQRPYYDYLSLLRRWRRLPGVSSMLVGSYDDPAVGRDIVRTVLTWLGHTPPPPTGAAEPRLNIGLPAALIELARSLRASGVERARADAWLEAMGKLPFTRAQIAEPRLLSAEFEHTIDVDYCRQLDQIEADPQLAPHILGRLPRPEPRRSRTISSTADALLELPSIMSGTPSPTFEADWLPRRLLPGLGSDLPAGCAGSVDRPEATQGVITLKRADRVMFAGWAFHAGSADAPWYLLLRPLDRTAAAELIAPLDVGTRRPDVAATFPAVPQEFTSRSGFRASLDFAAVPCGRYDLRVVCGTTAGLVHAAGRLVVEVGSP